MGQRHASRRLWLALAVAGAALLAGTIAWRSLGRAADPAMAAAAGDRPVGAKESGPAPFGPEPAGAGRTPWHPSAGPGRLRLRVVGENGRLLPGGIVWRTSDQPILTSSLLAPDLGHGPLTDRRLQHDSHQGTFTIQVPAGHWTWARLVTRDQPGISAYLKLRPFQGDLAREVVFSEGRRVLHVFTLREDLRGPLAGARVALYRRDLKAGGDPSELRSEEADEDGYVRFEGLEPGMYLACAPGARPGEGPPQVASVVLPPDRGPNEYAVTVQAPPRKYQVQIEVLADFDAASREPRRGGSGAVAYLTRVDDGSGRQVPIRERIAPGSRTVTLSLEAGEYRAGVVPQGELLPVEGADRFVVLPEDGQRFEIWLADNREETEVELEFVTSHRVHPTWFPVTVYWRGATDVVEDRSDHLFLGPHRWQTGTQRVRRVEEPGFLVATSRESFWMSREPVALEGGRQRARMFPASRLQVSWVPQEDGVALDPYLRVAGEGVVQTCPLARQLVQERGTASVGYTARLMAPQGTLVVECRSRTQGRLLWRREVEARHRIEHLRVEDAAGD